MLLTDSHTIFISAYWPEVEDAVNDWFLQRRGQGIPVSGQEIQAQAQREFRRWWADLEEGRRQEFQESRTQRTVFRASDHWLQRFMTRKRISHRRKTKDSRTLPDNAEEIVGNYRIETRELIREGDFGIIINMNETFVLYDMAPLTSMATVGSQHVDIRSSRGNSKLGCTVTLIISSTGQKGQAEVNFKGLDPHGQVMQELQAAAPENVRVTATPNGWARFQSLLEWLQAVVVPLVAGAHFLLVLDRYPAHRHAAFREEIGRQNGVETFIPGRCTSLLQPLDLTVMRSFKSHLRAVWKAWKIGHTDEAGNCDPISRQHVVRMISLAWERVNERTITNGWRISGLIPGDDDQGGAGRAFEGNELEEEVDGLHFESGSEEEED